MAGTRVARILYPHQVTVQARINRKKPMLPTWSVIATASFCRGDRRSRCSLLTFLRGLRRALISARDGMGSICDCPSICPSPFEMTISFGPSITDGRQAVNRASAPLRATEIAKERPAKLVAEQLPVGAERYPAETGDPVAVKLEDAGVDAVPLQQADTDGPGLAGRREFAALTEPGVLPQQRFESQHLRDVRVAGDVRPADVELAAVIVVQVDGELRRQPAADQRLQPALDGGVLR